MDCCKQPDMCIVTAILTDEVLVSAAIAAFDLCSENETTHFFTNLFRSLSLYYSNVLNIPHCLESLRHKLWHKLVKIYQTWDD